MKRVFTTLAIVLAGVTFAQVGINTENNGDIAPDAVFHVKNKTGEKKGVVLPEVTLNNTNQVLNGSTNSDGLLVWNNGGSLAKGYYYWDGSSWAKVGNSAKNVGSVYQKVRVFRGSTFSSSDIQDDDYLIAFTDVGSVAMPAVTDKYKNRTICFRNSTTAPFGTGAKQVNMTNVVAGGATINPNLTRCFTSFQDTDDQWYWISTSF
ncbi:hypothetical protein KRX57_00370 [Weeksellaceae bacterium TAE3-ERU29]|nr:hypothetical protein [Weeksellaceae bacterium TAE3-ERU29]